MALRGLFRYITSEVASKMLLELEAVWALVQAMSILNKEDFSETSVGCTTT